MKCGPITLTDFAWWHTVATGNKAQSFGTDYQYLSMCESFFSSVDALKPRESGRHFPDDIFKCISLNKKIMYFDDNFIEICPQSAN